MNSSKSAKTLVSAGRSPFSRSLAIAVSSDSHRAANSAFFMNCRDLAKLEPRRAPMIPIFRVFSIVLASLNVLRNGAVRRPRCRRAPALPPDTVIIAQSDRACQPFISCRSDHRMEKGPGAPDGPFLQGACGSGRKMNKGTRLETPNRWNTTQKSGFRSFRSQKTIDTAAGNAIIGIG